MSEAHPDSNDDAELDKLIAELDEPITSEESNINKSEKIKDFQAEKTLEKIRHDKPDWADKKNDDNNTYEYSDKLDEDDSEW